MSRCRNNHRSRVRGVAEVCRRKLARTVRSAMLEESMSARLMQPQVQLHVRKVRCVQRRASALAASMQSTEPLTPALSPSDGERECSTPPVERSLFSDSIHTLSNVLPLPFRKGEGRGEGSRSLHRYGLALLPRTALEPMPIFIGHTHVARAEPSAHSPTK